MAGADLILGQAQLDGVGVHPGDGGDRDRDLARAPEMAALKDEVRDVVPVGDEALDVAEVDAVGRAHRAGAADLDLALGDAVVADQHVRVGVDRLGLDALVIRERQHVVDADVPIGVGDRELANAQVGDLVEGLEPLDPRRG
jgi:hypothetical protein